MQAVEGEDNHHREIRDQQQSVESVPAVEVLEGLVAVVGAEIVLQPMLAGEPEGQGTKAMRKRCQQRCGEMGQVPRLREEVKMIVRDRMRYSRD
jgi:hypothetical protein